jgi:hypothetical protein
MIKFIDYLDAENGNEATLISTLANWTAATTGNLPYARWDLIIGDDNKDAGLSGSSAADISGFVLRETCAKAIESGSLYITNLFPWEDNITSVLALLLKIETSAIKCPLPVFVFEEEGITLHAVITWCLACSWSFVFLSSNEEVFLIGNDYRLEVGLKNGGEFSPVVNQTLRGIGFSLKDVQTIGVGR